MRAGPIPVLAAAAALALPARAGAEPVRLEEAIATALRRNPEVAAARAQIAAAEAVRKQARGRLGPTVRVDANVSRYDDTIDLAVGPGAPPLTVREEVTSDLRVTATQPLSALDAYYRAYRTQALEVDVARLRAQQVERRVALEAATGHLRLLQALAQEATRDKSVEQLQAQVERVEALARQGAAGPGELLRIRVAQGAARQGAIRARAAVEGAVAALALAMGLSPGEARLEPVALAAQTPPPPEPLDAALRRARAHRLDLRELGARVEQARQARRLSYSQAELFPTLSATATYQHTEGSRFAQDNAGFIGLLLQWSLFSGGQGYYQIEEAAARLRQVELGLARALALLELEVKRAHLELASARDALEVAALARAQAEEAFRIEARRHAEGASTTTDLLDAEAALTQARSDQVSALYQALIAQATLRSAVGDPIDAATLLAGGPHAAP